MKTTTRARIAALLALTLSLGASTALLAQAPISVADLRSQGHRPLDQGGLETLVVGSNLRLKHLASGAFYEAVFFASGIQVIADQSTPVGDAPEGLSIPKSARYAIEGDQLITRFADAQHIFHVYRTDDAIYAHRLADGDAVAWRIIEPPPRRRSSIRIVDLDARGISPMSSEAIEALIVGRRVTLLRRSTGERVDLTFGEDGISTRHQATQGADDTAPYTLFQDRLVTVVDGKTFFIAIYHLGDAYLAARYADDGVADWELLAVP